MRYWDEMLNKYGFGDGSSEPEGAEVYREVYVKVVNRLAERFKSETRCVAYDRPGLHNHCMILFVAATDTAKIEGWTDREVEPDDAMQDAIVEADEMGVDDTVLFVAPTIDQGVLDLYLNEIDEGMHDAKDTTEKEE